MALPSFHSPHWHHPHEGEHRFPVSLVVILVVILQFLLPDNLSLRHQDWICFVEVALLFSLLIVGQTRISLHHKPSRILSLILTSVMTLSNTASAVLLVRRLIDGGITDANSLLRSGASIWLTNIIIFSLWYWEFDRGGPGARAEAREEYADFLFPQMSDSEFAHPGWYPKYVDYVYVSITNASAFSPTDALPLSRWAKALMTIQSLTSLVTVGLVIARAVNILH